MVNKKSFALLPLDNRPVSCLLPRQIAEFSGIDLLLPERKYLGDLEKGADLNCLENWLCDIETRHGASLLIISLDTYVYGGLVQSRKHNLSLEELKKRVEALRATPLQNVYAFSSIMRIPNHDSSEEEKDYWKDYGEKIFNWSELMHKVGRGIKEEGSTHEELLENWYQSSKLLPAEVLADYKGHRDKNLTVNLIWLESMHDKCFEYLIFSSDDSGKYGMNVVEAEYLKREISKHRFTNLAKVVFGTDEIPLILFTKAVIKNSNCKPIISLYFNSVQGKNELAKYESNSIYNSVLSQIETVGLEVKDFDNSDMVLCVHCADSMQGDHVFSEMPGDTTKNVLELIKLLEKTDKLFIVLDLAYANGSDPKLVEKLISSKINWRNCYGYSAWNTCSNSTGSALSIGVNRWISEKNGSFNEDAFKKCLMVRFLDDYAYQAKIRHIKVTEGEINEKIKPYVQMFSKVFGLNGINVKCSLPWKRSFEVEIDL